MRMYTRGTSVYSLIGRTFVESAQNLTGEISGRAQSGLLARNGHPSVWCPRSIVLHLGLAVLSVRKEMGRKWREGTLCIVD